eukprot:5580387-Amphidinium_carterae.1
MQSLACTIAADHVRFHLVATNPGGVVLVVCLHTYILQSAAHFYCRHVTWRQNVKESMARTEQATWQKLLAIRMLDRSSRAHGLWFLACVLTAAPGIVYSTVKA